MQNINDKKFDQLSLKLLKILVSVSETRSTYKSAEQLYMSQSAVARGLDKLREILDDPLFIRGPKGLELTPYGRKLTSKTPHLIETVINSVSEDQPFSPSQLVGRFEILLHDPFMYRFGHNFMARLINLAPNVDWTINSWYKDAHFDISSGHVLLGVQYLNDDLPKSMKQVLIGKDKFKLFVRESHPLLAKVNNGQISLNNIVTWPFIYLSLPGWNDHLNHVLHSLNRYDIKPKISCLTDNLNVAMNTLKYTDSVLANVSGIERYFPGLEAIDFEDTVNQTNIDLAVCYSRQQDGSPIIEWILAQVKIVMDENRL